jgi:hypothetical protein
VNEISLAVRDDEIIAEINSGRLPPANSKIAFRQMLAVEAMAKSMAQLVEVLTRPPLMLMRGAPQADQQAAMPAGYHMEPLPGQPGVFAPVKDLNAEGV